MAQIEVKENELITNCDAIVFGSFMDKDMMNTIMTFIKTDNKIEPTELGYKFNIALWRWTQPKEEDVELFTAILGDPRGYVERVGKMGYSGLVVKNNACRGKDSKTVFGGVLSRWGFDEKLSKKVLKTVVV